MKKAYVKPVFLAEEFEMTTNVAGCDYHSQNKAQIYEPMQMCMGNNSGHSDQGHQIGGQQGVSGYVNENNLWSYATNGASSTDGRESNGDNFADSAYLFAGRNAECDFIWNQKDGPVGIWTTQEVSSIQDVTSDIWIADTSKRTDSSIISWIGSFARVFFGNNSGFDKHTPAYNGVKIFS